MRTAFSYLEMDKKVRNIHMNAAMYMSPTYVRYGFTIGPCNINAIKGWVVVDNIPYTSISNVLVTGVNSDNLQECCHYDYSVHSVDTSRLMKYHLMQSNVSIKIYLVRFCS